MKNRRERKFQVEDGGQPEEKADAVSSLESALDTTPEGLSASHDFLRLLGIVVGQVTLLDIATSPTADPAPRVAAARALTSIKEDPEQIAERLRSSQFKDLNTKDLHDVVASIREGNDPKAALQKVIDSKKSA